MGHWPIFVDAVENTRCKSIARPRRSGDFLRRDVNTRLPKSIACHGAGASALGKMYYRPLAHPDPYKRLGSLFGGAALELRAISQGQARQLFGFVIIGKQQVNVGQYRCNNRAKAVAIVADAIKGSRETAGLRLCHYLGEARCSVGSRRV